MNTAKSVAKSNMERFWNYCDTGTLNDAMRTIENLNYPPEITKFVFDPESYYFPDLQGDNLQIPIDIAKHKIAIVALENGHTYTYTKPRLHTLQAHALQEVGFGGIIERIQEIFNQKTDSITIADNPGAYATTYLKVAEVDTPGRLRIASTPTMVIHTNFEEEDPEPICPSVILHESVHILQILSCPQLIAANELECELEAYAPQATLASCNEVPYGKALARACLINTIRSDLLGPENYEPNAALVDRFRQEDVLRRFHYLYTPAA